MKRLLFFITHATLSLQHAEMTFKSISKQANVQQKFDKFYLYNTHENELSNNDLIGLFEYYGLYNFFNELCIFEYNLNTPKSLGADIDTIKKYCECNYDANDKILILKSDCYLSKNYFNDLFEFDMKNEDCYFTAPFIVSKARIPENEIIKYGDREAFVKSDDITFFVEDERNSSDNDFFNRKDIDVTDDRIRFISCTVQGDFSCHYVPIKLLKDLIISYDSWGGVKFYRIQHLCRSTKNSFVIHQYHDIISDNRSNDREGPVKDWMNS